VTAAMSRATFQAEAAQKQALALQAAAREAEEQHKQEISRLRQDITGTSSTSKQQIEHLRRDIQDRSAEGAQRAAELAAVMREKALCEKEGLRYKDLAAENLAALDVCRQENHSLRSEIHKLKEEEAKITALRNERALLLNEKRDLEQSLRAAEQRGTRVEQTAEGLQEEMVILARRHEERCHEADRYSREVAELRHRLENEVHKTQEAVEALQQCEATILSLQEDLRHRHAVGVQKEAQAQEAIRGVDTKLETYHEALQNAEAHRGQLSARIRELEEQLTREKERVVVAESEADAAAREVEKIKEVISAVESKHIDEIHQQQCSHRAIEDVLDARNQSLGMELSAQKEAYTNLEGALATRRRETEVLAVHVTQLQAQLASATAQRDSSVEKCEQIVKQFEEARSLWMEHRAKWAVEAERIPKKSQELSEVVAELAEVKVHLQNSRREEKRLRDQLHTAFESNRRRTTHEAELEGLGHVQATELAQLREEVKTKHGLLRQVREDLRRVKEQKDESETKCVALREELEVAQQKARRAVDDLERQKVLRDQRTHRNTEEHKRSETESIELEKKVALLEHRVTKKSLDVEKLTSAAKDRHRIVLEHLESVVDHVVKGTKAVLRKAKPPQGRQQQHSDMNSFLHAAVKYRSTFDDVSALSKERLGVDISDLLSERSTGSDNAPATSTDLRLESVHEMDYYRRLLQCALSGESLEGGREVSLSHFLKGLIDQRVRVAKASSSIK